jgi:hypothetical protein
MQSDVQPAVGVRGYFRLVKRNHDQKVPVPREAFWDQCQLHSSECQTNIPTQHRGLR